MKETRGIRNFNPGNIRKSPDVWAGLAKEQPDKEFFTFSAPEYGIRAIARILQAYQDRHDLHTIREMISRWAPSNENNTEAYVKSACKTCGIEPDMPLDMQRYEHMEPLVKAIVKHENGKQPYTQDVIDKGLKLAGVTKRYA